MQRRWKFKLGLDEGFELPFPLDKVHPDDIDSKMLASVDAGAGVPMSTIRMYIEHVSPFKSAEHSKNEYLNGCVRELFEHLEGQINSKMDEIKAMKTHVERLDEIAEAAEMLGDDADAAGMIGEDGLPIKVKVAKKQMCKTFQETGKCKDMRSCKFAHNPIELNLIPVANKIKNLNGVIQSQQHKLKHNRVQDSWVPAGNQTIADGKCIQMIIPPNSDRVRPAPREDRLPRGGRQGRRQAQEHLRARERLPQALRAGLSLHAAARPRSLGGPLGVRAPVRH